MVRSLALLAALAGVTAVHATTTCSLDSLCPEDAPCCSQYGECGVGAYCLGGCDPRMSYSLDACTPEPVCQSGTWNFDTQDSLQSKTTYLGDATNASWVVDGTVLSYDDSILLTMAPDSVGTVVASSFYMWYGNAKATLKTSRGAGVVTAFILFSDVKDEIDFEFVGVDLATAQTNYYFQGITDYTHGENITDLSDTYSNFHEYEVNWTPDELTWSVDGVVGRTLKRSDTWNSTSQQWMYPQTPSRVQLSIWPGGLSTNAQGTIDWAGGEIDWNSTDIQNYGYDFATVKSVTVQCYNATSAPGTNTGVSYYYDSSVGTNDTVVNGNNATVLSSLLATGLNMTVGEETSTASGSASSSTVATIPGLSGTGPGTDGTSGDDSGSSTSSSSSSSSSGFVQGSGDSSSSKSDASGDGVGKASIFAVVIAMVAMIMS